MRRLERGKNSREIMVSCNTGWSTFDAIKKLYDNLLLFKHHVKLQKAFPKDRH
jgi:hypothetical protein